MGKNRGYANRQEQAKKDDRPLEKYKKRNMSVYMWNDVYDHLKRIAEERSMGLKYVSMADLVREAIEKCYPMGETRIFRQCDRPDHLLDDTK